MYYVKMVTYSKIMYVGIEADNAEQAKQLLDDMQPEYEYEPMDVSDVEFREYEDEGIFLEEPAEYNNV